MTAGWPVRDERYKAAVGVIAFFDARDRQPAVLGWTRTPWLAGPVEWRVAGSDEWRECRGGQRVAHARVVRKVSKKIGWALWCAVTGQWQAGVESANSAARTEGIEDMAHEATRTEGLQALLVPWWPTGEEQDAVENYCTCVQVSSLDTGPGTDGPPDFEQDPYCVKHPDMKIVRATLARMAGELKPAPLAQSLASIAESLRVLAAPPADTVASVDVADGDGVDVGRALRSLDRDVRG